MAQSNISNPFDIKDSPLYYSIFEELNSIKPIKRIQPQIFVTNLTPDSIPIAGESNVLYFGCYEACNIVEGTDMKVGFYDENANPIFQLSTVESAGLNFSHVVSTPCIIFNYNAVTNVSYQKFIGFKVIF